MNVHRLRYKADVREPFMGNTVPLTLDILVDEDGYILGLEVINPEGIRVRARQLSADETNQDV